jgi:Putative zinc-finger
VQRDNDRHPPPRGAGVRGDRDRAIDHVLRQSLARGPITGPSPDDTCVDGEMLAAWTEGQLRGADADAVERHVSDCVRCQQLLAAFARTLPPPAAHVPLWRRWRLQWLVPIATAATVAAIWVAMPREEREAYVAAPANRPAAASQPAPPLAQTPPAVQADADQKPKRDAARYRANQLPEAPARKSVAPPTTPAATDKREEFERRDANALADLEQRQAAPATTVEADARARDNAADAPPRRQASQDAAREEASAQSPQAVPPTVGESRARSAQGNVRGFSARQLAASGEIVSPNPANRWRVIGDRQVERTTNSGAQWEAVTLPAGGPPTAGASPAPSICWIVGRSGAIYLTTDGSRFVRISFPERIDLISVTAIDDQRATVTAGDGRAFTTVDRGATWSTVPR